MNIRLRTCFVSLMLVLTSPAMADDLSSAEADALRQAGTIKTDAQLQAIALALHPGAAIHETELEHEYNRYEYNVELRDTQGTPWELEIDASTGMVYANERDD